ncbi:MAG TPA: DUF1990 family protein [Solirubrobacteraceae bacterium]|nr:DUF1990 family protein [Solirubrobacteraceae bacterium]
MTAEERLAALRERPVNYDVEAFDPDDPSWREDDYCQPLGFEPPGPPLPDGTFALACRLLRDYRFADPSIVRAHYDVDAPLEGRDMLLELRFHGIRLWSGCRVGAVVDEERVSDGRPLHVWGWPYRTLAGHIEQGEMSWEVWKWMDTGEVEFHIHSFSRVARDANPILALGFRVVGQRERRRYLSRACARMLELTRAEGA